MIGAIIGDIIGSVYEWDNHKSKDFPLFQHDSSFTDDTLCTIAIAESLLNNSDPAAALRSWGARYPDLSFGGRFRKWLETPQGPCLPQLW